MFDTGRELSQALEENRVLRIEIEELEQDRDTLIAALEEQHEEMTKAKQVADQAKTDYEDVQKHLRQQFEDFEDVCSHLRQLLQKIEGV